MRLVQASIFAALLLCAGSVQAQDPSGEYDLTGRIGGFGQGFETTLTLSKNDDGTYLVRRSVLYADESVSTIEGKGKIEHVRRQESGNWSWRVRLRADFRETDGAVNALETMGDASEEDDEPKPYAVYTIKDTGRIVGWVTAPISNDDDTLKTVQETGDRKGANDAGDGDGDDTSDDTSDDTGSRTLVLLSPKAGTYVAGERLPIRTNRSDAKLEVVEGDATIEDEELVIKKAGRVTLRASVGTKPAEPAVTPPTGDDTTDDTTTPTDDTTDDTTTPADDTPADGETTPPASDYQQVEVTVETVAIEVVEITVLDSISMVDAKPPHFKRAAGSDELHEEPALLFAGKPLKIKVKLGAKGEFPRSSINELTLVGESGEVRFEAQVSLDDIQAGKELTFETEAPLNVGVAVNALELSWTFSDWEGAFEATPRATPLRVYTTFKAAIQNELPGDPQRRPLRHKLHYELVCGWANGASENVGNGNKSLGYAIDNAFRHHVHPTDYDEDASKKPFIPHYEKDVKAPLNYAFIKSSGWRYGRVRNGERGIGSIFYPPLKAEVKHDWEEFDHYRTNYGWWVLDNPVYTGGRCHQQASLVVDLLGTVGIEAQVYYIERIANGPESQRPMRRHYRSSRSSRSWNYHGQAQATLADGSKYLYDGSGSSPPGRINGRVEELMKVPGRYVKHWELWKYEDGAEEYVPMNDWPETWEGVPLQEGETALDPTAEDGTYVETLGYGTMEDGKRRTFYVVNVGGQMLSKIDEGKPEAESYNSLKHGKIVKWENY